MHKKEIRANLLLLTAAIVWGIAFAFQKMGADHLGAFTFNGIRFVFASIALIPAVYIFTGGQPGLGRLKPSKLEAIAGASAGMALFFASFLQQAGIAHTTAGKAAFITGLYMVIVPIYGLFRRQRVHISVWIAIILAVAGMYFLSINEEPTIQTGDLIVFMGAFIWAAHIVIVDIFNPNVNPLKFSWLQFIFAAILSLAAALVLEQDSFALANISLAIIPLLYAGLFSAGVGYTLQILGQRNAKPAPATLILSMETVFAAIGGYFILSEVLSHREALGCALMIAGMLLAQYKELTKKA